MAGSSAGFALPFEMTVLAVLFCSRVVYLYSRS